MPTLSAQQNNLSKLEKEPAKVCTIRYGILQLEQVAAAAAVELAPSGSVPHCPGEPHYHVLFGWGLK